MKKIRRIKIITKTNKKMVVCRENLTAANENPETIPMLCPKCGEPILPRGTLALPARDCPQEAESSGNSLDET